MTTRPSLRCEHCGKPEHDRERLTAAYRAYADSSHRDERTPEGRAVRAAYFAVVDEVHR